MSVLEIGCCGAYCATCRAYIDHTCRGCKVGYQPGERDLSKARCRMKRCCLQKGYASCADCPACDACPELQGFYQKNGYKYQKYAQATAFIHRHGYAAFLTAAAAWKKRTGRIRTRRKRTEAKITVDRFLLSHLPSDLHSALRFGFPSGCRSGLRFRRPDCRSRLALRYPLRCRCHSGRTHSAADCAG